MNRIPRNRMQFSCKQREVLLKHYEAGLKSTRKDCHKKIQDVADEMNVSFLNVKYFIENQNRKVNGSSHGGAHFRGLRKRKPSTYNLFVKEKKKVMKGLNPGPEFTKWADEWRALGDEEVLKYKKMREEVSIIPSNEKERNARINYLFSQSQAISRELETLGVESVGITCDVATGQDFISGSQKGRDFLLGETSTLAKFKVFLQSKTPEPSAIGSALNKQKKVFSNELEKEVRRAMNDAYGRFLGDKGPRAFPYKEYHEGKLALEGLPEGLTLRANLSRMNKTDLRQLLDCVPGLTFRRETQDNLFEENGDVVRTVNVQIIGEELPQQLDLGHLFDPDMPALSPVTLGNEDNNLTDRVVDDPPQITTTVDDPMHQTVTIGSAKNVVEEQVMKESQSSVQKALPKKRKRQACLTKKKKPRSKDSGFVEAILSMKEVDDKFCYLIKWDGYAAKFNSWEPADNIPLPLLEEYHKKITTCMD